MARTTLLEMRTLEVWILALIPASDDISYELRAQLGDWEGNTAYAVYQNVKVSSESDGYPGQQLQKIFFVTTSIHV